MKQILLLMAIVFVSIASFSQSYSLDDWTIDTDYISIEKESTTISEGSSAAKITFTSDDNQDVYSTSFDVTADAEYTYTLDVYDNDAAGRIRMTIAWDSGNEWLNVYSADSEDWQTLTLTGSVPTEATTAQIRMRFYDVSDDWDGDATIYVDNAIYTEGGGTDNLITNGDFENWTELVNGTLTLTSPNGGESYAAGDEVTITWESSDVNFIDIWVYTGEGEYEELASDIDASWGSLDFTIPGNAWGWDGYILRIADSSNDDVYDESDAAFSITGHDTELLYEDFNDGNFGAFTAQSVTGDQEWSVSTYSAYMNGYSGSALENEDWLVFPAVALDNTIHEYLEFDVYYYYNGEDLELYYSTNYTNDVTSADWTLLSIDLPTSSATIETNLVDISALSGTVYFAFKYISTTTSAGSWYVDDIYISGIDDASTDIFTIGESAVGIYPNPFVSYLSISTANGVAKIELFNAVGQLVKYIDGNYVSEATLSTSTLAKGVYIVKVTDANGNVTTEKVIKK
jgi:hypothetical protein